MTTTNQDAWVIYPPANSTGGGGGGPGSDTTAIHDNVAGEISGIATKATPTAADILIIEDAAATFAKKKITIGSLPGGGGGGQTDTVAGASGITNTGDNVNATLTPTYGSAASTICEGDDARLSDARVPTGSAGGELGGTYPNPTVNDGADGSAIHDDIAGEILAVALKAAPVSADVLLIEDSAGANAKKRITIGSLPGGGGGQTDTVVGSGGITNVGTNVDADMAPTYGSAASTVCEGDDPRLSDARVPTGPAGGDLAGTYPNPSVAAITTTTGPTSLTIGAIADGEALRRSGATVIGYVPIIACCVFGGKSDSLGKFLIANGKSSDNDDSSKPKTRQPIAHDGTLVRLAYKTKEGTTSTVMKVHIDGTVAATVTLANLNAEFSGVETISVAVTAGQYVEIEYDASDKPGECTMYFLQELTL